MLGINNIITRASADLCSSAKAKLWKNALSCNFSEE